jgi:predicted amidohydrolase
MTINCCLVQFDIDLENKTNNLSKIDKLLKGTSSKNSVIFLPEFFNGSYPENLKIGAEDMSGPTVNWMSEKAVRYNSVIAGSLIIKEENEFYNRFIWCFPDGKIQYYNKRHMFCIDGEENLLSPGKKRVVIEYQGIRFCPIVCYDIRFPVWLRNKNDYDVIVCSANWPLNRKNVWNTLLRARAIENQSYVIGINRIGTDGFGTLNCGESQVIDFQGNIIQIADKSSETILRINLDIDKLFKFRNSFPVWKDADDFQINY